MAAQSGALTLSAAHALFCSHVLSFALTCQFLIGAPSHAQAAGEVAKIFTPLDFYHFASTQMSELRKSFYVRERASAFIGASFIGYQLPNHGAHAINRRIPGCNRLGDVGIKKLHFFESVGRPGYIGVRERSCHQCAGACDEGKFEHCLNTARCGCYRVLQLNPKSAMPRASTRSHRENEAIHFAERAKPGDFFACAEVADSSEKFTLFNPFLCG